MQYRDIVICGIIGNCHINIIGDKDLYQHTSL
jgi:hypothetical protein